jgi:alkylation response protein AidB-like acyl-CoA dehydrogenase
MDESIHHVVPPVLSRTSPEALEVTEAARQTDWQHPSFVSELFMGHLAMELMVPYPEQPDADRRLGDEYLKKVEFFLRGHLNPEEVDRTSQMPPEVIEGLAKLGCFGMKIPKEYGGMGLSQVNYNRVIALVASYCGSTAVWLSAHQSIGAPQPLKLFGTEEQKRIYLPRLASGTISAFALTEPGVGSDPANMQTTAMPTENGDFYLLNGEKLWCTNGPVAEVIIVMARTPAVMANGHERKQITAFIVEKSMPGFEVGHRCDFMGLKGIQNGVIRFHNVKVPKANIVWGLGQGLKLALITLNTGRLTLPAACVGASKQCLRIVREWSKEREQWGSAIGKHEAIAGKLAMMSSTLFAMDAMIWLVSSLADQHTVDIRLEAAMAKMFCSEAAWRIVDETMQIRGGRGYETYASLKARGEKPEPVERMMREARINTIIEGTSEIMRLFIAREALDAHLRRVGPLLSSRTSLPAKASAAFKASLFYGRWLPTQAVSIFGTRTYKSFGRLARHVRFVERASHRLALILFTSAAKHQTNLAYRQLLLGRMVEIGAELFAIVSACAKAKRLLEHCPSDSSPLELADLFCRSSRRRVRILFARLFTNEDCQSVQVADRLLTGAYQWLEDGIV